LAPYAGSRELKKKEVGPRMRERSLSNKSLGGGAGRIEGGGAKREELKDASAVIPLKKADALHAARRNEPSYISERKDPCKISSGGL